MVSDNIFETVDNRYRFTSVLIGVPESLYATDFAFRSYIILNTESEAIPIYGPPVTRSIYRVAKQIDAAGSFASGSSGDLYIKNIIGVVE